MYVLKRDNRKEKVQFDKISSRLEKLCTGLNRDFVDTAKVAKKVIEGLYDGVPTAELDQLAAETAATLATTHPDYARLAARIAISNLHKTTSDSFLETVSELLRYVNKKTGLKAPLVSEELVQSAERFESEIQEALDYSRDFDFDYFGFKTLENAYLIKIEGRPIERPQHLWMRVALGIHKEDIDSALTTYDYLSRGYFTHATPTLFNAGTPKPQMSSCFLLQTKEDSIEGIFESLKNCAKISQSAGGIGMSIHNIRASGSYIRGTGGVSNGIIPMLRVFNDTARYVDQGGGKRKGSFAVYLEPWHADIFSFLELRKNHGKEELRTRDLFTALWIPDLFMKRVKENADWSLFCPSEAPGLETVHGEEFETLYKKYEKEGRARRSFPAQDLWIKIVESQIETGTPYLLFKDACNQKSNQKNLGTIQSSNLCTEIIEYTASDEIAVCNLASLALPRFVKEGEFDHQKFYEVTLQVTRNLDRVIDENYYPLEEARNSNTRHRPIGIGVQGLADLFLSLRLPFDSQEAQKLNKEVFETLYFASLTASHALAQEKGAYPTFAGSPLSKGQFQFDLWDVSPSNRWDWNELRKNIQKDGVRNSLLTTLMPTASTSQILGNSECIEPYTSNLFTRRVLSGEFIVFNKRLIQDLTQLGLYTEEVKQQILLRNGSIQGVQDIPDALKELYKTVWEIKQRTLIDMAADRAPFICQSQSLNLFLEEATIAKISSMHFYSWQRGLKTGMYYLRTKAAAEPIKFTVDETLRREFKKESCSIEEGCLTCGS